MIKVNIDEYCHHCPMFSVTQIDKEEHLEPMHQNIYDYFPPPETRTVKVIQCDKYEICKRIEEYLRKEMGM